MGNSLIENISQDHKSAQKKSHQVMKVRSIASLTTTLMMILLPNRSFTIGNCKATVFLNYYKKKHLLLFFHLLYHESCFIYVRCLILVLLLTVCVINTITLYQKVQATSSVNLERICEKKEMCAINFYQILCLFSLQKLCHQWFL